MEKDPEEQNNLAFDNIYENVIMKMLSALIRHMKETGDMLSIEPHIYENFMKDYGQLRR